MAEELETNLALRPLADPLDPELRDLIRATIADGANVEEAIQNFVNIVNTKRNRDIIHWQQQQEERHRAVEKLEQARLQEEHLL